MSVLTFTKKNSHHYTISHDLGDLIMMEDGFFLWFPSISNRGLGDYLIKEIYDKMIELNTPMHQSLEDYYNSHVDELIDPLLDWDDLDGYGI